MTQMLSYLTVDRAMEGRVGSIPIAQRLTRKPTLAYLELRICASDSWCTLDKKKASLEEECDKAGKVLKPSVSSIKRCRFVISL